MFAVSTIYDPSVERLSHKSNIKDFDASERAAAGWQIYEMSQIAHKILATVLLAGSQRDRLGADDD